MTDSQFLPTSSSWMMFCTVTGVNPEASFWLIGCPDNEIEAVDMFNKHINIHGEEHAPYIKMVPYSTALEKELNGEKSLYSAEDNIIEDGRTIKGSHLEGLENVFRNPYENKVVGSFESLLDA